MISAWKRFINKNENVGSEVLGCGPNGGPNQRIPPGIHKLDKELQRKFARGVNYNMKVVIRGDARVGKTSLFLRLKGYGFEDNYTPTENLNVTSINWNYKATDDIVKIDLWEAIESTATKKSINYVDLKLENKTTNQSPQTPNANGSATSNSNGYHKTSPGSITDTASSNTNTTTSTTTKQASSSVTTITNTKLSMNGSSANHIPESARQSLAKLCEHIDVYKGTDAVLLVMDMTKLWTFKYIQNELPKVPKHIPVLVVANHRDQGHHRTVSPEQVGAFIEGLDRTPCDGTVMYTEASMKNGFGLKLIEKFFNIPFLKLQETSMLKQLELNRCEYMATLEELQLMQESTNREYEQYLELETIRRRQQADAMSPVNLGLRKLDEATREQIRNATMSSSDLGNGDKNSNIKSIESNNNFEKLSDAQMMASQNFKNDRLPSIVIGAKCPLPETKTIQQQTFNRLPQQQSQNQQNDKNDYTNGADEAGSDDSDDEIPRANPLVADYQSDLDSDDQGPTK